MHLGLHQPRIKEDTMRVSLPAPVLREGRQGSDPRALRSGVGFDPRRRGRGWGAPRGRGSQEGGAQGVGTGATRARGAGGGRLVFATAKSLWVYYKAELGGRGMG